MAGTSQRNQDDLNMNGAFQQFFLLSLKKISTTESNNMMERIHWVGIVLHYFTSGPLKNG